MRDDLSDWVIHITKDLNTLKLILTDGFLKPSFAPRRRRGDPENAEPTPTIRGPAPAVCFTEQPLGSFDKSRKAIPGRYSPYGIALHKQALYEYGGRPVIYGDRALFARLNEEDQYLWVMFNPVPDAGFGGGIVDWTHEREWRAKIPLGQAMRIQERTTDILGVPLLLPQVLINVTPQLFEPKIIVNSDAEVTNLSQWIGQLPRYTGTDQSLQDYFNRVPTFSVVSLNTVSGKLASPDARWNKLETLP
jgi:hypothetical protein